MVIVMFCGRTLATNGHFKQSSLEPEPLGHVKDSEDIKNPVGIQLQKLI